MWFLGVDLIVKASGKGIEEHSKMVVRIFFLKCIW